MGTLSTKIILQHWKTIMPFAVPSYSMTSYVGIAQGSVFVLDPSFLRFTSQASNPQVQNPCHCTAARLVGSGKEFQERDSEGS